MGLYGAPLRSSSPRYHTHCALLPTVGQFGSRARSRHPSCCDRQLTPSPCLSTPPSSGLAHPSARPIRSASTTTLFRRSIPPVAGMGWDAHKDGGGWARPRSHGNGQSQTHTDDMATCDGPLGLLFLGRAMNAPFQYGLHRGLLCVASRLLMLGRIRFGVFHRQGGLGSVHEENVTSRPGMTAGCAATDDHQPDNHGDPTSSLEPSPRHGS